MKQLTVLFTIVFMFQSCLDVDGLSDDTNNENETNMNTDSSIDTPTDDDNLSTSDNQTDTFLMIDDSTQTQSEDTEQTSNATLYIYEKSALNTLSDPLPKTYYFELRVPEREEYEISLDDNVIISDTAGFGELLGPASGLRSTHARILESVVIEQSGSVKLSVQNENETQYFMADIDETDCVSNEDYYDEYVQSSVTQCTACHSESGDAPHSFTNYIEVETYIENHNTSFATQPGKTYHGGGQRFEQNDSMHQRFLNLQYRVVNNWVCL